MLADMDIRQLVEFESPTHPVLSVYLDVDPQRRSGEQYKLALRNLLNQADKATPEDLKRVQNFVEMGYNRQGRGLVMFSCAAENFWWGQSVQVPVTDSVFVSFRAYVRQLARLMDTYERYGVIHIDQEGARLYLFNMGVLEAAEGHFGETIKQHRAGGWAAQRYQRHEMEQARHNLQDAAEIAEEFYRQADTRRLILAGTDKNIAKFKGLLSHRLRNMVIGQINAKTNATPAEIGEKALQQAHEAEMAEETAMTDSIITQARKRGNAVLGLAETLTAVQEGRAQHVVVLADYVQPAYRFVESGLILLDLDEQSELHSGRLQPLPDAIDSVIRRALVQKIGVSVVDQHAGLAENGKIGALTRY